MARNRVIGRGNAMPWHLPSELQRFKRITLGHHIVMGRRTFESIGRLLPGRTSVIVTRNPAYAVEGAIIVHSLDEALRACAGDDEPFVIGGAQFEIERFTADVVAALNAADAGRAVARAKADAGADGEVSLREARGPAVGKPN